MVLELLSFSASGLTSKISVTYLNIYFISNHFLCSNVIYFYFNLLLDSKRRLIYLIHLSSASLSFCEWLFDKFAKEFFMTLISGMLLFLFFATMLDAFLWAHFPFQFTYLKSKNNNSNSQWTSSGDWQKTTLCSVIYGNK